MGALRVFTVLFCAYDIVLVPYVVFSRTQGNRVIWAEIGYSIGIDLLLLRNIVVAIIDKRPTDTWISLIGAILIAAVSYYFIADHGR